MAGGRGSKFRIEMAKRRQAALELRLQGCSYRAIAEQLKLAGDVPHVNASYNEGYAHRDIMTEVKRLAAKCAESAGQVRDIELSRLDALLEAVMPKAIDTEVPLNQRIEAGTYVLRIMERRAKYLALDAPEEVRNIEAVNLLVRYENPMSAPESADAPA